MSPLEQELDDLVGPWATAEAISDVAAAFDPERTFAAALLEQMPVGVVVQGLDGAILAFNTAASRILRLTPEQLRGRTSFDPAWRSIHVDGSPFPGDTHPAMRSLQSGERDRDVMGVRVAEDEPTWIDIDARPVRNSAGQVIGVVSLFTDITSDREAEATVAQTLRRLEVIASEASDVMIALDETGAISYATPSARRILGRDPESLVDTRVPDLFGQVDAESVQRSVDDVLQRFGSSTQHTLPVRMPTGNVRWFELRMKNYLHDPDLGQVLVTFIDVDDRVGVEEELRRVNVDLQRRLDELDRAHQLDRLLGTGTELLVRCVNAEEVTDVLWDCTEQAFAGHSMTLRLSSPSTGELQPIRSTSGPHASVRDDECWALRTRRVHLSEVGGVRCHHISEHARVMCIPFVVDGRVIALAEIEHDHLPGEGTAELTNAATSMTTRLSTAIPSAAVADLP